MVVTHLEAEATIEVTIMSTATNIKVTEELNVTEKDEGKIASVLGTAALQDLVQGRSG